MVATRESKRTLAQESTDTDATSLGRCYDRPVDVETASAIERIDKRETSVCGKITGLRGEFAELREEVAGLRREVGELRVEMRDGLDEMRRHATMLHERTHEILRMVAEGVAHLSVKLDSLSG